MDPLAIRALCWLFVFSLLSDLVSNPYPILQYPCFLGFLAALQVGLLEIAMPRLSEFLGVFMLVFTVSCNVMAGWDLENVEA